MSSKLISATLALIAIYASTAHAQDASQTTYKFSGFGTLGVSHSSESRGDYVSDASLPHGAGISNDWAAGNDSRLGVQVSADFSPQLSAVIQVVSEYDSDNTYKPFVEWANIKYSLSPDLNFRVGRIGLPTFLNSDNRDVGYSYPWLRAPVDLYRQLTITHSDGVDGSYRFDLGDGTNVIKGLFGRNTKDLPTSTLTSNDLWGIFDNFEYGDAVFRVAYQSRETSTRNNLTGVTSFREKNSDLSVGASYDPGNWFLMSEWIQLKSTTKRHAMYVSSGIRVNKLTPYVTYSQDSASSFISSTSALTAADIQAAKNAQHTISIGTRWDFMKNIDLKVQYDTVKLSADSNGDLANVPAGTILYGETFHVISVAVDFLF